MNEATRVSKIFDWFKNHRVYSVVIVVFTIIISLFMAGKEIIGTWKAFTGQGEDTVKREQKNVTVINTNFSEKEIKNVDSAIRQLANLGCITTLRVFVFDNPVNRRVAPGIKISCLGGQDFQPEYTDDNGKKEIVFNDPKDIFTTTTLRIESDFTRFDTTIDLCYTHKRIHILTLFLSNQN